MSELSQQQVFSWYLAIFRQFLNHMSINHVWTRILKFIHLFYTYHILVTEILFFCIGCGYQVVCSGGAAGVANVRRSWGCPVLDTTDPSRLHQPSWQCLCESVCEKKEKAAQAEWVLRWKKCDKQFCEHQGQRRRERRCSRHQRRHSSTVHAGDHSRTGIPREGLPSQQQTHAGEKCEE